MSKVKPGYKETEVGVIPEDWYVKELCEVTELKRGKFTPRPRNNPIFYGGNIPFVQTGDVTKSNGRIKKYTQTLNQKGVKVSIIFPKGTILMTIAANIGYSGILQVDMACPDSLISINGFDNISNKFLNYYFNFRRKNIENLSTIGAQKNINVEKLRKFPIPLPPTLAEQEKIATALSDTDSYIEKLEKLIEKKKYIKTGAMQELLTGKKRLPGVGKGKGYKETPVGVIPEDWEVKKLGEVAFIKMGQSPLSIYYNNSNIGLPLVQGNADLKNRKTIIRHYTSYITKKGSLGDVIMSVRAPVGEIAICVFDCCLGRGVCAISYPNKYLYHYMVNQENNWSKYSSGSTFDSVNSDVVYNFPFGLPPTLAEQEKIATVLSDMDSEIEKLEVKLDKYKNIKQGMMQKLLTGEIRLV